ncbi:MAG: hypothetical protein GKC10_01615 [Methanosarcinales archaeon]|nr:hypothetical protein [Methanosarcinales archaeon]
MKCATLSLGIALLMLILSVASAAAAPGEASGTVTNVVNGDTFDVQGLGRVKLADVTCPEVGSTRGDSALAFTLNWLQGRRVYLDLDNPYAMDEYGRYIAVAYLANPDGSINVTQNFNRILVDGGQACVWDVTTNDFDPADWWGGQIPAGTCVQFYPGHSSSVSSRPMFSSDEEWALRGTGQKGRPFPWETDFKVEGTYMGNLETGIYHKPTCTLAKKTRPDLRVWFNTPEQALYYGLRPCDICNPEYYGDWLW